MVPSPQPVEPPADPDAPVDGRDLLLHFQQPVGLPIEKIDLDDVADRITVKSVEYDPVKWAEDRGIFLWSRQRDLLRGVVENERSAWRACHEVGKSFAVCVLILSWVDTYGYDSFVLWSAPTHSQMDAVIGRELRGMVKKFGLDHITVMASNQILYRGRMVGYGRSPSDHNPQPFSGLHARRPLVVLDEGGALKKLLFDSANTVVGNENGRLVTIGNPDNPVAHFRELFKPESEWHKGKIDAYHSPNFTEELTRDCPQVRAYMAANDIPYSTERVPDLVREVLLHPTTAERWITEYGPNSPYVTSKLNAEFPDSSDDAVYPYEVIDRAQAELDTSAKPRCLTVDIGGSGPDETAAYAIRQNGHATLEFTEAKSDLMKLADRIHAWWLNHPDTFVVVDANGLGEGVFSRLKQLGVRVRGFYGHTPARNSKTYANARAEAAHETSRAMRNDLLKIDRFDDRLRAELPNVLTLIDGRGRFVLMSKEEMQKRGIASPNRADAISMGVWELRLGVVRSRRVGLTVGAPLTVGSSKGYAT